MYRDFIAGEWVEGARARRNINPSDARDVIGEFAQTDREQTRARVAAARDAFRGWSTSSPQRRFDALDASGTEILARRNELCDLPAREEGKTLPEAIGEVVRAGNIFKFFAGEALRTVSDVVACVRPGIGIQITREPLGVVCLITPWNVQIAIPAWKLAPALAYGNTVIMKPADLVPGSAWMLDDILQRAGLPKGVFNLTMGRGAEVGAELINHPDIAAIRFTGGRRHRAKDRRGLHGTHGQVPAGDGWQEPLRRARRR